MSSVCDQCRKPATRTRPTVTGRELCDPCQDELMGLTAGTIAGGGEVGPAIATAGFFSRLRERRRR